jgi:hypothetical protein
VQHEKTNDSGNAAIGHPASCGFVLHASLAIIAVCIIIGRRPIIAPLQFIFGDEGCDYITSLFAYSG